MAAAQVRGELTQAEVEEKAEAERPKARVRKEARRPGLPFAHAPLSPCELGPC